MGSPEALKRKSFGSWIKQMLLFASNSAIEKLIVKEPKLKYLEFLHLWAPGFIFPYLVSDPNIHRLVLR